MTADVGLVERLRAQGWAVAVHNDYRLNGKPHTFWLLTNDDGRYVKGEGRTDAEALEQCQISAVSLATIRVDVLREAANIAGAIDSKRGNEAEIRKAILALIPKEQP